MSCACARRGSTVLKPWGTVTLVPVAAGSAMVEWNCYVEPRIRKEKGHEYRAPESGVVVVSSARGLLCFQRIRVFACTGRPPVDAQFPCTGNVSFSSPGMNELVTVLFFFYCKTNSRPGAVVI